MTRVPAPRSAPIRSRLAHSSHAAIPAPRPPVKMRTGRPQRSGRKLAVDRASRRSDRAARAAPKKAIHRVRCSTRGMEPGMPWPTIVRPAISIRGSRDIAARSTIKRVFSTLLAPLCCSVSSIRTIGSAAGLVDETRRVTSALHRKDRPERTFHVVLDRICLPQNASEPVWPHRPE